MNGAEHYRAAERMALDGLDFAEYGHDSGIRLLAAAAVHAKLAEVALQAALAVHTAHMTSTARAEWSAIGSVGQ